MKMIAAEAAAEEEAACADSLAVPWLAGWLRDGWGVGRALSCTHGGRSNSETGTRISVELDQYLNRGRHPPFLTWKTFGLRTEPTRWVGNSHTFAQT